MLYSKSKKIIKFKRVKGVGSKVLNVNVNYVKLGDDYAFDN